MSELLNYKHEVFCHQFLLDGNGAEAARRAGFSEKTAKQAAYALLKRLDVQERIKELKSEQVQRLKISSDEIVKRWWDIATLDANEITENRIGACRFCYGTDFQFQWKTQRELDEARSSIKTKLKIRSNDDTRLPNDKGGFGYDITRPPVPTCPECNGLGVRYHVFHDSRKMSPAARSAYRGVKITQNGLEIMVADQDKATENIAKYLGMFVERSKMDVDLAAGTKAFLDSIMGGRAQVVKDDPEADP